MAVVVLTRVLCASDAFFKLATNRARVHMCVLICSGIFRIVSVGFRFFFQSPSPSYNCRSTLPNQCYCPIFAFVLCAVCVLIDVYEILK